MPNIERAGYGTIAEFGTRRDFDAKLQMMGQTLDDVVDYVDQFGVSLLGTCLSCGKFDFAKELLAKNAKVNRITREGCNEFHLMAARMHYDGALDVAWILLDRGVSLMAQDQKYKNTAIFTLCLEAFRRNNPEYIPFLKVCFDMMQKSDFDIGNKAGFTLRRLVNEHGPEHLQKTMEEKQ